MSHDAAAASPTDVLYGAPASNEVLELFDHAAPWDDSFLRSVGAGPYAALARMNPSLVGFALSACAFLWAAASHGTRLSSSALVLSVCVASAVATVVVLIVEARAAQPLEEKAAAPVEASADASRKYDSSPELNKEFFPRTISRTTTAPVDSSSSLEASALLRSDVAITPDLAPVSWVRVDSPINRVFPFIAPTGNETTNTTSINDVLGSVASSPEKVSPSASPAESTASSTATIALSPKAASSVPATVLVIEDNPVNVKVVLRMLGLMGLKADVAENGLEGVRYVERYLEARRTATNTDPALFPPLFILCDLMMPVLDGHQAAERIRHLCAREPGVESPHIVAVTADVSEATRKLCLVTHFDDYLAKPLFLAHLRTAWSKFADRRATPLQV